MSSHEQGSATRSVNRTLSVDFDSGVEPDEVRHTRAGRLNIHVAKLFEIVDAIQTKQAEVGKVYPIAKFGSRQGAASARRLISKPPLRGTWPQLYPQYQFTFRTKMLDDGGSELWAGISEVPQGDALPPPAPTGEGWD